MTRRFAIPALVGLLALTLTACGGTESAKDAASNAKEALGDVTEKAETAAQNAPGGRKMNPLLNPRGDEVNETAPKEFKVEFETTAGNFTIFVHRDWAPRGADRLYNLVKHNYYADARFFRVVKDFMVQWGIAGDPNITRVWRNATILDDRPRQSNTRGMVTFAKTNAPHSRSTQLFINFGDNSFLDAMGFAPIGEVVEGMETVDAIYAEYGDAPPNGKGPLQPLMVAEGNEYLMREFSELDYIKQTRLIYE